MIVVKHTGSGPATPYTPSVIGFESNPKACVFPAVIVQTTLFKRSKIYEGGAGQSNADTHTDFLVAAWGAWTDVFPNSSVATYRAWEGARVNYSAFEMRKGYNISGGGPYTLSVQIRHQSTGIGVFSSGSKTYLASNPAKSGILDGSIVNTCTEMFTLSAADAGDIEIVVEDANGYPLLPDPLGSSGGQTGCTSSGGFV